jgi:hypothetical protein|tara:strand:+ start:2632 stop:3465 length:834 start_codon:yes stop_codon:yes gene_type:complete
MYALFLYSIIFSWIFASDIAPAATGVDRCDIRECLCEVLPGPRPSAKVQEEVEERIISVYFEEDQYILYPGQRNELSQFFAQFERGSNRASIIGRTDGCGSFEYNKELSSKRAEEVFLIAKRFLNPASVGRISGGEKSDGHLAEARRVDVVVHTHRRVTTAIEKIPADYYLIDASGSMWDGYRDWNDVVNASVKPNSRVFLSIVNGCRNGRYMGDVRPHGGTEIWWSYWNIIDKMDAGETLLIVSDFESQVPLSGEESRRIREKVRQAGIIVRSISP